MTTTIAPDTLIQVQDVNDGWHAAAVGPGVLCQHATAQQESPGIDTVVWDYGTDRVNCRECIGQIPPSVATVEQQVAFYAGGRVA